MRSTYLYYLLLERDRTIAAVLLLVGALGVGTAGWAYTHPPTTEITDQTNQKTIESAVQTQAVVSGETNLYQQGTLLKNQPAYLVNAAPNATLLLNTSLPTETSRVDQELELVYTATRDGAVFWKRTESIETDTIREGQRVNTRGQISALTILAQQNQYQQEFSDAATVSVGVRVSIDYTLDQYSGTLSQRYPLESGSGWYSLSTESLSKTHGTPETHTRQLKIIDKPIFVGPAVVGIVSLLAGFAVIGVHRRNPTQASIKDLETDIHHQRYEEWISRGVVPKYSSVPMVNIETLEDLVDVAIDAGERVIYDTETEMYVVIRENVRYYYDPRE